ncbi:MAG: sulfotransferase [Vicinamibacteraceae bacterium]
MTAELPVIVVSGLPRSGTSMTMGMLRAGGVAILSDGLRVPDHSNPKGYFEFDPVQRLAKAHDASWLVDARGKAVKIVSSLLLYLPHTYEYRVIFMHRDLREVIASQNKMIAARGADGGTATDETLVQLYERHLGQVRRMLAGQPCFRTLDVEYRSVLANPDEQARRIDAFLGGALNVEAMRRTVDAALYRNRAGGNQESGFRKRDTGHGIQDSGNRERETGSREQDTGIGG